MESILQKYLSSQIININEDENHKKLLKASTDVVKILARDKGKIQQATLIAFDPDVDIEDPIVIETKNLIIKHWTTFINKCQNMPLTYVRAVLLHSLAELSKNDDIAAIIWLSAASHTVFYNSELREKNIFNNFLENLAERYENSSIEKWALTGEIAKVAINVPASDGTAKVPGIKSDYIGPKLIGAVSNGQVMARNPSYGNSSVTQEWANEFGSLAAAGLNEVFSTMTKQVNDGLAGKASLDVLQKFATVFNKEVAGILNKLVDKNFSVELRGQLLWFKEALYSNIQKQSYRKLSDIVAVTTMPFEFSELVPEYCPISTEYFLAETLREINADCQQKITIQHLISLVEENRDELKPLFNMANNLRLGRISLITFIGYVIHGKVEIQEFEKLTGISPGAELSWADFANWLYREFQALKIIIRK